MLNGFEYWFTLPQLDHEHLEGVSLYAHPGVWCLIQCLKISKWGGREEEGVMQEVPATLWGI